LTATATPQVRDDILQQLELKDARVFSGSFNRPNLTYGIQTKQRAFDRLQALLVKHQNAPTIIYCFSRRDTEDLAADLRAAGVKAAAYHAGLRNDVRQKTQEQFIRDEVPVICATIAFGMGIDKPDVRLVVHYDLPKSIEGYYQETGRAGRDGLPAECVLFYSYGDKFKQEFFIKDIADPAEKERAERKLAEMINFAETTECRRKFLLEYFGEPFSVPAGERGCGGCDSCLTERETFDATEITQKILSCIVRTGQRFGAAHIAAVLTGSQSAKIKQLGHDALPTFGIVQDFSLVDIQKFCKQLAVKGFLVKADGQYPTLALTAAGSAFLQNRELIRLVKPIERTPIRAPRETELAYDEALFEELRKLRKEIATREDVPPFVVFGDRSLIEMAAYLPQDLGAFEKISGVGARKLAAYGEAFVQVIQVFATEHQLEEQTPPARGERLSSSSTRAGSTYSATRELLEHGLSIAELARQRGLTPGTIVSHLEKLVGSGEELPLTHLRPPEQVFHEIAAAFQAEEGEALSPVYERLRERYGYDQIRLVRLLLQVQKN
jgi:ATP-dependent DNA helicase RecQ